MKRTILSCSCLLLVAAVGLADEAPNAATIGKPAPDFTATGIDGNEFKLSEKIATGKNIVLIFSRAHW